MTNTHHRTGEALLESVPFFYEMTGQGHPLVLAHAGIAATAHFPNMERPDKFNQTVLDFLASLE